MTSEVREYLPLEQGLRHRYSYQSGIYCRCQRVSSIRTRIKTILCSFIGIETIIVREYLPLEQGLRHIRLQLPNCSAL